MNRIRKKVDFSGLITHRFAFVDLHAAFEEAIHGRDKALKVMLEI
jgi:threonine dehydrogenase-like Zn-dependent dehydrogenase